MAILFKAVDRIAADPRCGSYKSMITTYTVARLSLATDRRIDLDRIWREQSRLRFWNPRSTTSAPGSCGR